VTPSPPTLGSDTAFGVPAETKVRSEAESRQRGSFIEQVGGARTEPSPRLGAMASFSAGCKFHQAPPGGSIYLAPVLYVGNVASYYGQDHVVTPVIAKAAPDNACVLPDAGFWDVNPMCQNIVRPCLAIAKRHAVFEVRA
jgi:hypothetical protein